MCVDSVPKVDKCVVDDFVHVDHEFEASSDGTVGGHLVERWEVYSRVERYRAVLVQSIIPASS